MSVEQDDVPEMVNTLETTFIIYITRTKGHFTKLLSTWHYISSAKAYQALGDERDAWILSRTLSPLASFVGPFLTCCVCPFLSTFS